MNGREVKLQKITVNVPEGILADALAVTGKGITQTVCEGLERVARSRVYARLGKLYGKSKIELDVNVLREDRYL